MYHGKVVPWGFIISGLRCVEEVFVSKVVCGRNRFEDDGVSCMDELCFLCARCVLEEMVIVGVAHLVFRVHKLVYEDVEPIEGLFKSGLWNGLCVEDDPC